MEAQSPSDTYLFYSCSIISFLESRVDTYVENLEPFFGGSRDILEWLEKIWLPEEQEHGRLMKRYVEKSWPNFRWDRGFEEFSNLYIPQCATEKLRRSIGLEALARCVTETEATMIYRCLASYSSDPELTSILKRMSADEVRHYRKFRDLHIRFELIENNSFLSKARTVLYRSKLVRDEDLALAFKPLNDSWSGVPPFKPWSYEEYLRFTASIMRKHFPFSQGKRMLFHPLKTGGRLNKLAIEVLAILAARQFLTYA